MKTVLSFKAREAAYQAMNSSLKSLQKIDPNFSENNLRERSESFRVKSEDLSQEAEGLRRNADDMGYQIKVKHLKILLDLVTL